VIELRTSDTIIGIFFMLADSDRTSSACQSKYINMTQHGSQQSKKSTKCESMHWTIEDPGFNLSFLLNVDILIKNVIYKILSLFLFLSKVIKINI